jgi:hypothetical protein
MKMSCMFVTALVLPRHGAPHRSLDAYFAHFQSLVDAGVPLCVFLDERIPDTLPRAEHVRICRTTMEGRWMDPSCSLPSQRNPSKDTLDYMSIQLSKFWFVHQATELYPDVPAFAWIDFGAFHMFRDVPRCQSALRKIATRSFPSTIVIPGCWARGNYPIWDSICWRFCGTFFVGQRNVLRAAYDRQCELVRQHLPALTWEVNYWTLMEEFFTWIPGDHCDLLIDIPEEVYDA